ncbi:meiotic recombination protein REC114 [Cryptotermes secundus]|uniref:meiotic recombination protein REC114 n=1 Tax=Cryptotermes secundus TaxID=105785 RepID=UPI000CD7DAE0|nr:meiotic recombination protein REC114 [Cryptotermes secundus]
MWPLEKYARWDGNCWHQVDSSEGQLTLLIENMQLLVVQYGTVFESVSLASGSGQLRGVWKDTILVIVIKHQKTSRRFRVKFTATDFNSALSNSRDCVTILSQYISIRDPTKDSTSEHMTISEWCNRFMKADASNENTLVGSLAPEPLPPEFPLEKTIQLCILDTSFLELVNKVDAVLQQMHL